jgi:NADH-quinone oxidoreductase subunit F
VPTGEIQEITCDNVILAIGEKVDSGFIKEAGILLEKDGRVIVDPFTLRTNNPKIYAGGDLVTGPSTVSQAMAAGKKFAQELEKSLFGLENWNKLFSKFKITERVPTIPEGGQRRNPEDLPIPDRSHNFHEVNLGYCEDDMKCEACRCLRCDVKRK